MSKYETKRKYQYDVINSYCKKHLKINYSELGKKLNCCRQVAKKLYIEYKNQDLINAIHKNQ